VCQSLRDIEIVCVNDGSTDDSRKILQRFATLDPRIRVIDQDNAGLSAARNAGAEAASGEYLYFLDSDDYIDHDALEGLYERATRDRLDVVYFNGVVFFENDQLEAAHPGYADYYVRNADYPEPMSGADLFARMSENDDHKPMVPMQMFRTEFYRAAGLSFYEGILHEDNLFSFLCAMKAERAGYAPRGYFHRRVRADSIVTTAKGLRNFKGFLITYLEMQRFVQGRDYPEGTSSAIARLMTVIYLQAVKLYCMMSQDERDMIGQIDTRPDALALCTTIKHHGDERLRNQKLRSKLKKSNAQLARIRGSRTYRFTASLRKLFGRK
jgi:glycosyltransferase involved in cell wall biosynthesis